MKISVIIPGRNCVAHLARLAPALAAQTRKPDEIVFVDDASTDDTAAVAASFGWRVIRQQPWQGPGAARNRGAKESEGDAVAFTDADCAPDSDWLERIVSALAAHPGEVVMGRTRIPPAGFWGDAISDLGFPGGANLGFEKVWRVDAQGHTDHISSCNFALTRPLWDRAGGFDTRFSGAGCEDAELSLRWSRSGIPIRYRNEVVVWHAPRRDLPGYVRWHLARGRSNRQFKRVVGSFSGYWGLRLWYLGNLVRTFGFSPRLPVILGLTALSFGAQAAGYLLEKRSEGRENGRR